VAARFEDEFGVPAALALALAIRATAPGAAQLMELEQYI
jgi:hypothetical protein